MKRSPTVWLMTIVIILACGCVAVRAQGIQPSYPVGTTLTTEQYKLNWCVSQHWLSGVKPDGSLTINFAGKWTDDQKIELIERCGKFMKNDLIAGGIITSSRLISPRWASTRASVNGMRSRKKYAHAQQPKAKPREPVTLSVEGTATLLELNRQIGELQAQIENLKLRQQILLLQEGAPKDYPIWQYDPASKRVIVYPPKAENAKKE